MQRDMSLIRQLLLKLESLPENGRGVTSINATSSELQIDGYDLIQINYHLQLIIEADLIKINGSMLSGNYLFSRLSWAGHDFLDSIRDEDTWNKTKDGAIAAGGFTLDLLKDLAKGFIRKKIEEQTGISL